MLQAMIERFAYTISLSLVTLVILSYATLSLFANRPLSAWEYGVFSRAIAQASWQWRNNGAIEVWRLAQAALANPVLFDSVIAAPLPPYSVQETPNATSYVTFATPVQLEAYYTLLLPQVGWRYIDNIGNEARGNRIYHRQGEELSIVETPYMGAGVRVLDFAITDQPAPDVQRAWHAP